MRVCVCARCPFLTREWRDGAATFKAHGQANLETGSLTAAQFFAAMRELESFILEHGGDFAFAARQQLSSDGAPIPKKKKQEKGPSA